MKLYLDLCLLYRPFDDQSNERIKLETQVLLVLLEFVSASKVHFINSFALEFENSKNPNVENRYKVSSLLKYATQYVEYDEMILSRALSIEKLGIMSMDALHIACAEASNAECFVTCDDNLVNKLKKIKNVYIVCYDALDFVYKEIFKL